MPALTVFGRQWSIGSDDFVFPGCAMLFIRSLWAAIVTAVYASHHKAFNACLSATSLKCFYIGMMVLLYSKVIVNIFLIYHSSKGTIKECGARRLVAKILYIKFALFLLEAGWLGLGSYWASDDYEDCDWLIVSTVRVLVGLSWIGVFVFIMMIAFLFSPLGHSNHTMNTSRLWKRRCQVICCNCCGSDDSLADTYAEIASLVSGYFEDVDLTPSDVAAGLLLVSRDRKIALQDDYPAAQVREVLSDRHHAIDITDPNDMAIQVKPWMTITNASRIMSYALAVYGWPLYSLIHLPFGCCSLACSSPTVNLSRENLHGDTCDCNLIAVERGTIDTHCEIFFASFTNQLFVVPFVIFRDHEAQCVVISIRGTLSLKDVMVDMTAIGEELGDPYPKTYKAHKGMIKSAANLLDRLDKENLLKDAMSGEYASYDLVLCGHSLGAGVASILALLIKPRFPNIKCFAFSPPGGLLSEEAYKASKEHTLSVVLGDDLVPRLSIKTMQDLKVTVMAAINDCQYPKYKIFWSLPFRALHCKTCLLDGDDTVVHRPLIDRPATKYTTDRACSPSLDPQYQEAIESRDLLRIQPTFFPPGCIMYITSSMDSSERGCCTKDPDYKWRWAKQTEFLNLMVSPKMGADHMPNAVRYALNQLVSDYPSTVLCHSSYQSGVVT